MHNLAHIMTKLCQGRKQDNAGWESVPVYDTVVLGKRLYL